MNKPLRINIDQIPSNEHEGSFGIKRRYDIHTGIDIYCQNGERVYSIEDGIIIDICKFTGFDESPWWNDTYAVAIKSCNSKNIWLYGEISNPNLQIGDCIKQGQNIGNVSTVLKKDKNKPMTMLHIELYSFYEKPVIWNLDEKMPKGLENPTGILQKLYKK